jgi:FecR protein
MRTWKSIAALVAGAVMAAVPAVAQQVGTATAVNPLSESTPPGASTVALTVGSRVVHKERIHTTPTGSVQLLFLDKSTLSIAPNTSILIDEYVYNPNSGQGHMLASLTQGALRFVGGKLSHEGDVTVQTPAAAIGIRGATGNISYDSKNGAQVIDLFGTFTITNGATDTPTIIYRQGFMVTVLNWHTLPGPIIPAPQALIEHFQLITTSQNGQNGGVNGLKNVIVADCDTQGGSGVLHGKTCPGSQWSPTDGGESNAFQLIIQATQQGTGRGGGHTIPPGTSSP